MDAFGTEEEEIVEGAKDPQVNSSDPVERKLARRLRIQRRLETAKKNRDREVMEEGEKEPKNPLEQQIMSSMVNLEHLIHDGQDQVSNVRVASDAREVKRRKEQADARAARLKLVEDEARESLETLEEINEKWKKISHCKDPLDIYSDMEKQKAKCEELLQRKNAIIEKLNKELDRDDEQFRRDQKKQKEDLNLLAERIDNHIEMIKEAYKKELEMLDEVIQVEQKELIDNSHKEWEELYKERDRGEVINMKKKFELITDYEKEMDTIYTEHFEKYREAKMRLEADFRVLQQELEKIKALCLLNSEKLDYNFLILKKRDAENIIMKAHQKRRINKLQDVVNSLRGKIEEAERTTKSEKQRLTDDVLKLHKNIIDIGHKADSFAKINDKRYNEVWEMNEDIAKGLLEKILTADKIIHEQQLGLPWQPPDLTIMTKEDLPSYRSAIDLVEKLLKEKDFKPSSKEPLNYTSDELQAIKTKGNLLRNILHKIADSGGFLVEEKLFPLLFPYKKDEKTLLKIESIFKALGVESEEDVQMLKEYFIPYVSCDICGYSLSREQSLEGVNIEAEGGGEEEEEEKILSSVMIVEKEPLIERKEEVDLFTSLHRGMTKVKKSDKEDGSSGSSTENEGGKDGEKDADGKMENQTILAHSIRDTKINLQAIKSLGFSRKKKTCSPSHPLQIDPIYVLKALRAFVTDFSKHREVAVETMSDRLAKEHKTVSRSLKTEEVKAYWSRFTQIFGPEREKLWDALMIGLHKYLEVLQARHKLNEEVHALGVQNEELKRLLQQHLATFGQGAKRGLPPIKSAKQIRDMCK